MQHLGPKGDSMFPWHARLRPTGTEQSCWAGHGQPGKVLVAPTLRCVHSHPLNPRMLRARSVAAVRSVSRSSWNEAPGLLTCAGGRG